MTGMSLERRAEIKVRLSAVEEFATRPDDSGSVLIPTRKDLSALKGLIGTDVPALLTEVERLTDDLTGYARVLTVARSALAQADQHCPDADDHGPEVAHLCEACTQADTVRTALGAIDHLLKGRVA